MNYAEYVLIGQMANIAREINLLEKEGKTAVSEVPDFLKYNDEEINSVIVSLNEKYQSCLKAIEVLRSQNIT